MSEPLQGWFILELMGHCRLAGWVTEQTIAGAGFLRIDVPGPESKPRATQFYPPASVYAMTPTTEEIARRTAEASRIEPVTRWELRPALSAAVSAGGEVHDPDDEAFTQE